MSGCDGCGGTGLKGKGICEECNGTGNSDVLFMPHNVSHLSITANSTDEYFSGLPCLPTKIVMTDSHEHTGLSTF